jgi:hypothetical protein
MPFTKVTAVFQSHSPEVSVLAPTTAVVALAVEFEAVVELEAVVDSSVAGLDIGAVEDAMFVGGSVFGEVLLLISKLETSSVITKRGSPW